MPTIPADDLADIFSAGEIAMTAATVGAFTLYGVFENQYQEALDISGTVPVYTCRSSDVTLASIARGTTIVINSTSYTVRVLQPDGSGLTALVLEN